MATERIHNDLIPRCGCMCWLANGEPCQAVPEAPGELCAPCKAWNDVREFYRVLHLEQRRARAFESRLAVVRERVTEAPA